MCCNCELTVGGRWRRRRRRRCGGGRYQSVCPLAHSLALSSTSNYATSRPYFPASLRSLTQPKPEVLRQHPGGGRQFLALDSAYVLLATARDPALYEYAGAMRKSTDDGASGKPASTL